MFIKSVAYEKIFFCVTFFVSACAVCLHVKVAQQAKSNGWNGIVTEVEALAAGGESGDRIICRCKDGILTNDKCLASNDDDKCAQSEPGGNINCRDYSSNC